MEDNKGLARDSSKYKIVSISVVVIILITFWYMLNMVLLTFIMTFIFYNLLVATRKRIKKFFFFKYSRFINNYSVICTICYIVSID